MPRSDQDFASVLRPTPAGLCRPQGDFHIDPSRPVNRAVITHSHADHARADHGAVLATVETLAIMKERYGEDFAGRVQALPYRKTLTIGGVSLTLAPAGHVLGSAQAVVRHGGLTVTASRNAKLRLIRDHLAQTPDPDRGCALAALTGALSFTAAKPVMIRQAVEARVDPEPFRLSYDYVGDLAETAALISPVHPGANREPELSEVIDALNAARRSEVQPLLEGGLSGRTERPSATEPGRFRPVMPAQPVDEAAGVPGLDPVAYEAGRPKGSWFNNGPSFKWKRDPHLIDAVLMYAQRGHGKRSSYYSDYIFGVWTADADGAPFLTPVGKAYFGFTDEDLKRLDKFVCDHTVERFGPVRHGQPAVRACSGDGLRRPAALAASQIRRRHAVSAHQPHPLGQARERGRRTGHDGADAGKG